MQNSVNLVGLVKESYLKNDICYFKLECTRSYKEKSGEFLKDIINCRGLKSAIDSFIKIPEEGKKIAVSGSLLINEIGEFYIDVYQIDYF